MADESREFAPLMICIEQMLTAFDGEPLKQSLSQSLQTAATELRGMFQDFDICCCRRAHVVVDVEAPAASERTKPGKKTIKSKKPKAGKAKAGKKAKAKSVSARSRRR